MKPITVWRKFNVETQRWEHNHIENGHVVANKPTGTAHQTKAWEKSTWMFEHKHLNDQEVV